jgi:hypothetical protein
VPHLGTIEAEIMRTVVKRAIRDERGAALALALVLLVVGGLVLTPLLGLMSTGLIAGQVYEKKTHEYYAADSGVEDAIWKITHDETLSYPYQYHLTVGGKAVGVVIDRHDWDPTCGENLTYQILSIAATDDGGGTATTDTSVDAHLVVSYMDLGNLLDNAIVSDNFIRIYNGVSVTGNVTSGGAVDNKAGEDVNGTITEDATLTWPTAENLAAYYWDDVEDLEPSFPYSDPFDIAGADTQLKALYMDGPWTIFDGSNDGGMVTLTGTVYIRGDLDIGTQKNEFTLNLNNQTIFVGSASADAHKAISIGDRCTVIGSGCIIAVGDVYFSPKGDVGSENNFVLVMSVNGTTTLQPSGTFYGCIAGNACVEVRQGYNANITHTPSEGKGLNFPMGFDPDKLPPVTGLRIESWEIK